MNFFGKKGGKSKVKSGKQKERPPPPEYKPYEFNSPDAFSDANLAQVYANMCRAVVFLS